MTKSLAGLTGKPVYKYRAFELLVTLDLEAHKATFIDSGLIYEEPLAEESPIKEDAYQDQENSCCSTADKLEYGSANLGSL